MTLGERYFARKETMFACSKPTINLPGRFIIEVEVLRELRGTSPRRKCIEDMDDSNTFVYKGVTVSSARP